MKKSFYLFILFVGIALFSYGQSQRLVLLEHLTQASCGPCATYNPTINNLINANPDKITAVMYHTSWPGYDPMYLHNTVENGARTSYYSVNSVPNSVLDGNVYNGHPSGWNINTVNARYDIPSPFEIYMHHELSADQNTLYVNIMILASEAVNEGMKVQTAVIEKHIHFSSPPGSNGETDFYSVMKKLLPNQSGVTLPAFEPGDYVIIQHEWEHQNVYELDELAAVGFVQNNGSKEVLQSANSSSDMLTPLYSNDVELEEVTNISLTNCDGKIQPAVKIRNNGSANLTELDIMYSINGGDPVTYAWTGNLGFLESETVLLSESSFSVDLVNPLEILLENPNGQTDEYANNNGFDISIEKAPLGDPTMVLYMILDDNPQETTWEMKNYEGDIIYEGGPYTNPGQTILEELECESTNCYTFTIYDEGGDGLSQGGSIAFGFGSNFLINEVNFGSKAEAQFRIEFTGISEVNPVHEVKLYPNPVNENTSVSFMLLQNETFVYSLVNMLGETIQQVNYGEISAGEKVFNVDLSGHRSGIYYLQLKIGDNIHTEKIVLK